MQLQKVSWNKSKKKKRDENGSRVWINILTKYNTHHPK